MTLTQAHHQVRRVPHPRQPAEALCARPATPVLQSCAVHARSTAPGATTNYRLHLALQRRTPYTQKNAHHDVRTPGCRSGHRLRWSKRMLQEAHVPFKGCNSVRYARCKHITVLVLYHQYVPTDRNRSHLLSRTCVTSSPTVPWPCHWCGQE